MADEEKPVNPDAAAGVSEKMFSGKGLIVFMATIAIYTIVLFYALMGGKGNPDDVESGGKSIDELKIFEKLLRDQSGVPKFFIKDIIVNIKMDKSGDTTKVLRASLAFSLGFTKKELKAIESEKWPPEQESTKFGNKLTYDEAFNITTEVTGGGEKPADSDKSYLRYLGNNKEQIRGRIMQKLNSVTYNDIKDSDGKANIAQSLQSDVNEMLYELGFYKRVYKIDWINFTFN